MNRTTVSTFALLIASAGLTARADNYLNFLRQTHYDTAVAWDVPISLSGTMASPLTVGRLGSLYELWALNADSGDEVAMDREIVSPYSPQIVVTFETGDPYEPLPRTRVDQPFTARVTVTGANTSLPDLVHTLHVVHMGYLFPSRDYTLDDVGDENEPQVIHEFSITDNGVFEFQFPMTNLTGDDLTKIFGAEFFAITSPDRYNRGHGNNADHVDGDHTQLAKKMDIVLQDETIQNKYVVGNVFEWSMVQIWPIAEATIEGFDTTVIYHRVPPISIKLVDLYPESTTYLRAYQGPPSATPTASFEIGPASVMIRDSVAQDRTIVVRELDRFLPEEGSYTLEVLHETPFGTEILAQTYPLQVNWDIDFRGSIFSID